MSKREKGPRVAVVRAVDIAAHPTHRMDAEYWLDRQDRGIKTAQVTVPGRFVAVGTDCVHVCWEVNGEQSRVSVTHDHWGDRAPVVAAAACTEHQGCRVLTVAPDGTDSLEYPHVRWDQQVGVTR